MKKNIKFIIIFLVLILIAIIAIVVNLRNEDKLMTEVQNVSENKEEVNEEEVNENENEVLVVCLPKETEAEEEPEEEPVKDAATLTQEIYNMNTTIGTLYIPKTGLNTQIYCNVTVDKMEEMPCFLYTTGGLNAIGTTLFVGHNRMNGKLFSNNDQLEVDDEFYFTDYEGTELKYTIYSIFITTESDTSFLTEDVDSPTIALSCCTDENNENRIIVMGKVEN